MFLQVSAEREDLLLANMATALLDFAEEARLKFPPPPPKKKKKNKYDLSDSESDEEDESVVEEQDHEQPPNEGMIN